jgi:hypothetical protein
MDTELQPTRSDGKLPEDFERQVELVHFREC